MKKSKFTESQIVKAIKEHEQGRAVTDICRELSIHQNTFYKWKQQYGGMDTAQLSELKRLQEENARLKKMYAELSLDNMILKDVLTKKF